MKLSILICTIPEREKEFDSLINFFNSQSGDFEVIFNFLPKGAISIGEKRNALLKEAKGDYVVFFDDDDEPYENYISEILAALEKSPDCVGFKIRMTTNGVNEQTCIHSLSNPEWVYKNGVYLRNVTHFNPVKRDIALSVGFPDISFGEDKWYSDRVTKLCKKEFFIDKYLFHYRYSNKLSHKEKYG